MSRASLSVCFLLAFVLLVWMGSESQALVPVNQPYIIWPDARTGNAYVYFKNSGPHQVEVLWVGVAAWDDVNQVKSKISQIVRAGVIPYIQSYNFGDNGLRGNFNVAVEFDTEVAKAIGNSFAIINMETEWDDDAVMALFQTSAGKQCLLDRIQAFRTYAPNAVIVSSPGFWKPASAYAFFAPIDKKLNQRAMLNHVVNSFDTNCARTPYGGNWPYGAKSTKSAIELVLSNVNSNFEKIDSAWGENTYEWIMSDVAVTSCGWGDENQAQILHEITNNIDCLYASGFRGYILRNAGPDVNERAMGVNNEGMFKFSSNPYVPTVLGNGLTKIVSFLRGTSRPTCSNNNGGSSSPTSFTVRGDPGLNEWWVELFVDPASRVTSMTFKCNGQTTTLTKSSWSNAQYSKGLSSRCPIGSSVELNINGQRYSMTYGVAQAAKKL